MGLDDYLYLRCYWELWITDLGWERSLIDTARLVIHGEAPTILRTHACNGRDTDTDLRTHAWNGRDTDTKLRTHAWRAAIQIKLVYNTWETPTKLRKHAWRAAM